jgi:predicted nucleic acid-binding protein
MRPITFDSFAVLAWLREEPGAQYVTTLLWAVHAGDFRGGISVVNLGEVYYSVVRREGIGLAETVLSDLREFGWEIHDADETAAIAAARLKARFPISYADAFALACAQEQGAALVTGDPEILAAGHGIPILWPGVGDTPKE